MYVRSEKVASDMKSKVRYYRQEAGITQKELGKMAGVARQTINSLENGKYNPLLLLAYKITTLIGFKNIHDVFTFEKEDLED
jgi:putative transcriptional regulator